MAAPSAVKRILVYFQKSSDLPPVQLNFTQKPSFCPISNMNDEDTKKLPAETQSRGIDVGSVAIVQSADDKVLLIRRPNTMRSFPGIWVPPGGHIEENEELEVAALRELQEETGLTITDDMCHQRRLLCAWESVFPPVLGLGLPKRHHAVFYVLFQLRQPFTAEYLTSYLKPDHKEVASLAWLDRKLASGIVVESSEESNQSADTSDLPAHLNVFIVANDDSMKKTQMQTSIFLTRCPAENQDVERVSTGTKHALGQWLLASRL